MEPHFDTDAILPLIAQEPAEPRDSARLLVIRRDTGAISHHIFRELPDLLGPGDLLVLNDTRVLPARLIGRRERTGGKWEGLFLQATADGCWELLSQTRGTLRPGEFILVEPGSLRLELIARSEGHWLAQPHSSEPLVELLERHGQVPLPPYIRKGRAHAGDRERYQTIYARQAGAVAAPTAGLHFTPNVFARLDERGVERAFVTLHVGLGTFQPIEVEDVTQHQMHREWGRLSAETVTAIERCRQRGGRVVAVGTTTVRVLETAAAGGGLHVWEGETDLFIRPPYTFRAIDALVTNFHLPRSTLLLLVGAFAGAELCERAYRLAVEERYRFYSYGDAMLIL